MNRKLIKFVKLESEERWELIQAMILLPMVGTTLRILGVKGTWRMLQGWGVTPRRLPTDSKIYEIATRTTRLADIAARHGRYGGNCLSRSLLLLWLLRRRGIPCGLRIGVRKILGEFQAHAWVECFGRPVNDSFNVTRRFMPFGESSLKLWR